MRGGGLGSAKLLPAGQSETNRTKSIGAESIRKTSPDSIETNRPPMPDNQPGAQVEKSDKSKQGVDGERRAELFIPPPGTPEKKDAL